MNKQEKIEFLVRIQERMQGCQECGSLSETFKAGTLEGQNIREYFSGLTVREMDEEWMEQYGG